MHRRAAPGQLCPFSLPLLPLSASAARTACATQAGQEGKEEQVQLSLTSVLSGKEGEDGCRESFDRVLEHFSHSFFHMKSEVCNIQGYQPTEASAGKILP